MAKTAKQTQEQKQKRNHNKKAQNKTHNIKNIKKL
jgi:hypothetical protein